MKMRKIVLAMAAAALAAGVLAGCAGAGASSSAAASSAVSSEAASSAVSSEAAAASSENTADSAAASVAESGAAATAYDSTAFKAVLDKAIGYEADTAGGSLKNAQVADELVRFIATRTAEDTAKMTEDATAWLASLTEEQKGYLRINWEGISTTAHAIAADPASQKELLETAGVNADYTDVTVTGAKAVLDALDGVLGDSGK